jgi:uncharacterized protein (DUF1501 family)
MGGPVRGRRVYGRWSGLAKDALYQERDLSVTTDFREPIGQVLRAHLGLQSAQLERIFPNCPPESGTVGALIKV